MARRKRWAYSAGERGRNRVRAYEKAGTDDLYVEFYLVDPETGDRKRRRIKLSGLSADDEGFAEAKRRVDTIVARFGEASGPKRAADITLRTLFDIYLREVTPGKGKSKRGHDGRARRVWLAFFGMQAEPKRRSNRKPDTLDRVDWDRFIAARRGGEIPGWRAVRNRQVAYDLKFLLAVLNWATGAKAPNGKPYLVRNPWGADIRRAQGWTMPKEPNPRRPAMTDELREKLIAHAPSWQFGLALILERETRRRNSAISQLRWSDIDLDAETVRWRAEFDKQGRHNTTPLTPRAVQALRSAPERGIGETPVFPSDTDPEQPTPRNTFQVWLRRAKHRYLRSLPEGERERMRRMLYGLGFHAEKRAGVRDPAFRKLPPKVQEEIAGTNFDTLKRIYDDVGVDEMRRAMEQAKRAVGGA